MLWTFCFKLFITIERCGKDTKTTQQFNCILSCQQHELVTKFGSQVYEPKKLTCFIIWAYMNVRRLVCIWAFHKSTKGILVTLGTYTSNMDKKGK